MEDYECIFTYLESGIYPAGLSKNEKRNLRRKCNENFKVENGQLYYRRSNRCTTQEECEWKLCIKTVEEKQRVLRSCHSSATGNYYTRLSELISLIYTGYTFICYAGGHFGRDKATEKVCSRVYWGKCMHAEIADYIKRCDVCQRVNNRFNKPPCELHPIPVSPEVWKQVTKTVVLCVHAWHDGAFITS